MQRIRQPTERGGERRGATAAQIAELIAAVAEQLLPTGERDESAEYAATTRARIGQLAASLGVVTNSHKEETVRALRAVLLRLAHAEALPTDKAARELVGVIAPSRGGAAECLA